MKCKTCGTEYRGIPKHGGYCLDHQEQRAESAEARAAEQDKAIKTLRAELDLANAHAARLMQERDEARRQYSAQFQASHQRESSFATLKVRCDELTEMTIGRDAEIERLHNAIEALTAERDEQARRLDEAYRLIKRAKDTYIECIQAGYDYYDDMEMFDAWLASTAPAPQAEQEPE